MRTHRLSLRSIKPQGAAAGDNKPSDWTFDEDELLRAAVFQYGGKKWKIISTSMLGRRSPTQCNARWNELQNLHNAVKSPWSSAEDARMMELVGKYGPGRWAVIASYLPGRNGKQCRERWHNQLNPAIKKESWSPDEDRLIIELQAKLGNAWAKIADRLSGRTDNAVKNRWHSSLLKSSTSRATRSMRQSKKRSGTGKNSIRKASATTAADADAAKRRKKMTPSSKACDPDSSNGVSSPTAVDTSLHDLCEKKFPYPPLHAPPLSPPPTLLEDGVEEQSQGASAMSSKVGCEEPQSFHELLAAQSFGMELDGEEEELCQADGPSQPSFEAIATPDADYLPLMMMTKMFSSGTDSDEDVDATTSCESFTFSHCGGDGIPSLTTEGSGPCVVVKDEFFGSKLSDLQLRLDEEDQLLYHSVWRGDPVVTGTLDPVVVNMAPLVGDCKEEPFSCGGDTFVLSIPAGGPFAAVSDASTLFSEDGFPSFPMPRDDKVNVSLPSYCGEDVLLATRHSAALRAIPAKLKTIASRESSYFPLRVVCMEPKTAADSEEKHPATAAIPLTRSTPSPSALNSIMKPAPHQQHQQQQQPQPLTRAPEPNDRVQLLRVRYRNYQRNHRAKQQQKQDSLQDEILALKHGNSALEARKRELLWKTACSFVREYFQMFGLSSDPRTRIAVQQQFLRSKLHEHVEGQDLTGVAQFEDQVALYAHLFRSNSVALQSMRIRFTSDEHMAIVTTSAILTLDFKQTIWNTLCPHLSAASPAIQQRLASRTTLRVPGCTTFVLHSDGLLHKLYREFDFYYVFQRALGSIEQATLLMEEARISFTTGTIGVALAELGRLDGAQHSENGEEDEEVKSDSRLNIAFLLT